MNSTHFVQSSAFRCKTFHNLSYQTLLGVIKKCMLKLNYRNKHLKNLPRFHLKAAGDLILHVIQRVLSAISSKVIALARIEL